MRPNLLAALIAASSLSQASVVAAFSFSAPTQFTTGAYPTAVAIGDVTGDGRPDLVTVNNEWSGFPLSSHALIREQTANGTLAPAIAVRYGTDYDHIFQNALELVDLNGDGLNEIAIGATGKLSILMRQIDGSFALSQTIFGQFGVIESLAAMDVNLDGRQDMVAFVESSTSVRVFLGDGAGGFSNNYTLEMAALGRSAVAAGDLNSDGLIDLAAGHFGSNGGWDLTVRYQSNIGTLGPHVGSNLPDWNEIGHGIETADFTGDGRTDVVLIGDCRINAPSSLWLFRQSMAGALGDAEQIDGPCGGFAASRDVDLDGRRDIVMAKSDLVVYTQANAGLAYLGTFPLFSGAPTPMQGYDSIALGDLNSDACPDAAVSEVARGVFIAAGQNCPAAADLAVRLTQHGGGNIPRTLDIELAHLGGQPVAKTFVNVRVVTRERVTVPTGCKTSVESRSYSEFECYPETQPTAGNSIVYSLALGEMAREDWRVTATVQGSLPDPSPENNSRQLRLVR